MFGHFQTDRFLEFERQRVIHGAVLLDFSSFLVKMRLGGDSSVVA